MARSLPSLQPVCRIDQAKVDATTEEEIEQHRLEDAAEARMDAARALLRILDRAPTEVLFSVL